jgi:hypothetical protein
LNPRIRHDPPAFLERTLVPARAIRQRHGMTVAPCRILPERFFFLDLSRSRMF